jgi:cell fate regulator YaaT (PSP1 superfamily)
MKEEGSPTEIPQDRTPVSGRAEPRNPEPRAPEPRNLVRVRLARNGRNLDCDCGSLPLRQGDQVVVDDRRATALAMVIVPPAMRVAKGERGRVIRKAEPRDVARAEQEHKRQQEALGFARQRAKALGLPIKLFRADVGQGSDRATFFFSCEQRVDFRALVRDLSAYLHARVEMRQVGVRDESRLTGGIGSCGRELCCSTHLTHFAPVSIKMAKHQRLVLNPTKIAGQCGRLKCCLVYEDDLYVELSKGLPKPGKKVETPEGIGRVDDLDVLGGRVRVSFLERPPMTFLASEVKLLAVQPAGSTTPTPQPQHETTAELDEMSSDEHSGPAVDEDPKGDG